MKQIIRIGMDTSKHFFQLHGVDAAEQVVLRKKLKRKEVLEFFGNLPPTIVGDGGLRRGGAGTAQAWP
jgi:transposase